MAQAIAPEKEFAPYAPPANVLGVIQRFREYDVPTSAFTPEFMERIGVPSGSTHRTIAALKFLGLLDKETAEPTDTWRRLHVVTDEEFAPGLEVIVRNAYADVFKIVDPAKDSQGHITNAFRKYAPAKQRDKMVVLFLGLCSVAGIPTVDAPRRRTSAATPGPQRTPASPRTATPSPTRGDSTRRTSGSEIAVISAHPLIAGLLRELPGETDGARAWTRAQKAQWLKAADAVLDLLFPVSELGNAQDDVAQATDPEDALERSVRSIVQR